MELLEQSSTFFGVLVTLIVLCVFSNSNNFIHTILKSINDDQIKPQINKLEIDTDFKSVRSSTEYRVFQELITGQSRHKLEGELLKKALSLDLEIQSEFDRFRGTLTPKILKPANDTLEIIIRSKEQIMAPLYSLLVCLTVFVCDEIVCSVPSLRDAVVTFLSSLIFMSFLFWGFMWISLWLDVRNCLKGEKTNRVISKIKKLVRYCDKWNYRSGIRLLAEVNIAIMLAIGFLSTNPLLARIILFAAILLPMIAIAIHRLSKHSNIGIYSYDFLLNHFCVMLLISLMVTVTFGVGSSHHVAINEMLFKYENYRLLKYGILNFIMINGLVMPFVMPYWGYKYVFKFAKHKTQDIEDSVGPVRDRIILKLKSFLNEVDF